MWQSTKNVTSEPCSVYSTSPSWTVEFPCPSPSTSTRSSSVFGDPVITMPLEAPAETKCRSTSRRSWLAMTGIMLVVPPDAAAIMIGAAVDDDDGSV